MSAGAGELHVEPGWADGLGAAGVDSFDALFATRLGRAVSTHDRGWVRRLVLPDGRELYLKVAAHTQLKLILGDLLHGRRAEPLTEKERRALLRTAELGIAAPRPIAWGQRRRLGLPWRGVLAMTPLAGGPLDAYLAGGPPADERRAVFQAVGRTLRRVYAAGLAWPDLRAKHVYVADGPAIGLLDLERLGRGGRRLVRQVRGFCRELQQAGASEQERQAFLGALDRRDILRALAAAP